MGHVHEVHDTDVHFKIDPVTRAVSNASETKRNLFKGDHNSERFTFELPKKIDGHDMSSCDKVEIHYINTSSSAGGKYSADIYLVTDMKVSDDNDELITFSWLISGNATQYVGQLNFAIRFICTDENGDYSYIWNTAVHSGVTIVSSITNDDIVVNTNSDAYRQWEAKFFENISNVIALESPTESTNILVEDGGSLKRVPASAVGGSKDNNNVIVVECQADPENWTVVQVISNNVEEAFDGLFNNGKDVVFRGAFNHDVYVSCGERDRYMAAFDPRGIFTPTNANVGCVFNFIELRPNGEVKIGDITVPTSAIYYLDC